MLMLILVVDDVEILSCNICNWPTSCRVDEVAVLREKESKRQCSCGECERTTYNFIDFVASQMTTASRSVSQSVDYFRRKLSSKLEWLLVSTIDRTLERFVDNGSVTESDGNGNAIKWALISCVYFLKMTPKFSHWFTSMLVTELVLSDNHHDKG